MAAVHPHLGGLSSAFTKCHSTCLRGERGSEQKLALEHGHRSENLQGRKQRVSWAALVWVHKSMAASPDGGSWDLHVHDRR